MPLTYALFFWFGCILIQSGAISFHDLIAAMNSLLLGAVGTGIAVRNIFNLEEGSAAGSRMFLFLEDSEHDDKEESHDSQGASWFHFVLFFLFFVLPLFFLCQIYYVYI